MLTRQFAERHGLKVGEGVELVVGDRVLRLRVRGLLRGEGPAQALGGNIAVMDIAAAQAMFARSGRIDRLEFG